MQDPIKVQRPGLSYHLSEYWWNLCREGTIRLRGQCQPAALFNLQAAGFGRVETYDHYVADRSIKIPKGTIENVLIQVDKFYYPIDFVVLDTEPVVEGPNYVPIILGRPFLATSNAIINFRNGVMQLTFRNMTLELNIFHLSKKHMPPMEEDQEQDCHIDAILGNHYQLQQLQGLTEELGEVTDELQDTTESCAVHGPWRKKEEILPLLIEEDSNSGDSTKPQQPDLKPLPAGLKYGGIYG